VRLVRSWHTSLKNQYVYSSGAVKRDSGRLVEGYLLDA